MDDRKLTKEQRDSARKAVEYQIVHRNGGALLWDSHQMLALLDDLDAAEALGLEPVSLLSDEEVEPLSPPARKALELAMELMGDCDASDEIRALMNRSVDPAPSSPKETTATDAEEPRRDKVFRDIVGVVLKEMELFLSTRYPKEEQQRMGSAMIQRWTEIIEAAATAEQKGAKRP